MDVLWQWFHERPDLSLLIGPRGGGKSFLSAIDTHCQSKWNPGLGTRILGGSKAQSEQVYNGIDEAILSGNGPLGSDADEIDELLRERLTYRNGSVVQILSASPKSVRGPHVPTLRLDEVDEIDDDIRQAAMGMCMSKKGVRGSVLMTSTWHNLNGPVGKLVEEAKAGAFPLHTFCVFEVLERCPEERSGPNLEKCPECPLVRWCHAERDQHPRGLPKAKLSDGHYTIDSLIQKTRGVSVGTLEADYLCRGPKAEGRWFPEFHRDTHVTTAAEFNPALHVHVGIDSGVYTGAVFFQVLRRGDDAEVNVFADYLGVERTPEQAAREIREVAWERCGGQMHKISTDPNGGNRSANGPAVIGEYKRAGLHPIVPWPVSSVSDSLATVSALIDPADGVIRLKVHPRCERTVSALEGYRRAKRYGHWQDYPEEEQHPFEDLVDALRGGLKLAIPAGRRPGPRLRKVDPRALF